MVPTSAFLYRQLNFNLALYLKQLSITFGNNSSRKLKISLITLQISHNFQQCRGSFILKWLS